MITLVDYGAGNIRSVANTLQQLGASYSVTSDAAYVEGAEKIILPGVGHFGQMMHSLDRLGLRQPLIAKVRGGIPFLGICVGLQCLFEASEESPGLAGLGIFPGEIRRFVGDARIPHMGWNSLSVIAPSKLLRGLHPSDTFTYFAHSYYAPLIDATAATCTYIQPYSAVIEQNNIHAVQFHPEKSSVVGLRVLGNFLEF